MKIDARVSRVVGRIAVVGALFLEALEARAGFDHRAIDGEVITAHQLRTLRLRDDDAEKLTGDIVLEQPLAVVRKRAVLERRLDHAHVQKPTKEKVVGQLLTRLPLAAQRVERHQQRGLKKSLRRNRRATATAVHRIESRAQFRKSRIAKPLDFSNGWSAGTNDSGDIRHNIEACFVSLPRITDFDHTRASMSIVA